MTKLLKPSNVWIQIEHTSDRELLDMRIEKLNQFCTRAGIFVDGYGQKFWHWEHPKRSQTGLAYTKGLSGGFDVNTDWGQWFNLDYLADPENFSWEDHER